MIGNKELRNKKLISLEKKIDILFWGWLCFSSIVSVIILIILGFLTTELHILFNTACVFITLCFMVYYLKQIISVIKREGSKTIETGSPSVAKSVKDSLLMWSNILMGTLLAVSSTIWKNTTIILWIFSILSFAIGMLLLSIKNSSK